MEKRIYFLDNLRTFLVFLVVLYHAGIVYQGGFESGWIVSDPIKSKSIGIIGLYLDAFVMFSLFFISGFFMPASLKGKTVGVFIKSKLKRIGLPWLLAVLTLIPLYKVIFLYSRGLSQQEWFSYFHLFQRAGSDASFFANDPTQHWLWFLPVLLLFQLAYYGLSKTRLLSINISLKNAVVLIFLIGVTYSKLISGFGLKGWSYSALLDFQTERLLIYFMIFLLGSLCYKLKIFESETRNKKYYILSNVVLTIGLTIYTIVALNLFFNIVYPERNYFFVSKDIDVIAYYASLLLTMLSLLHIIIDAFRFKLNKTSAFMNRLNSNSYYVYIIHMIIIGVVAMALMTFEIPTFLKYFIVTVVSYVVCNLIIEMSRKLLKLLQ